MKPRLATVPDLLALFNEGRPSPILLLGAGASLKSGVPLAGSLVERAAKWSFCRYDNRSLDDPTVRRSDWLNHLHAQHWYDKDKRPEDNYFQVMQRLLVPKSERREFFLWVLKNDVPASIGYEHLLSLLDKRIIATVLTTNFDSVIPDLKAASKRPHHLNVIRTKEECAAFSTSPVHPQLVYLHGAVEYYTDQTLETEIQQLRPDLIQLLSPLLRDHPLVVVGYRGAEPSVMKTLLQNQAASTNNYAHGIYWCSLDGTLHQHVVELANAINPNLAVVMIKGFDELMEAVARHTASRQRVPVRSSHARMVERLPFDMTPLRGATLEELDWRLVKEQLVLYRQRMQMVPIEAFGREDLIQQLLEFDLLVQTPEGLVPTAGAYLLFASEPSVRIKSARVEVFVDGKKSQDINGHLWRQRELLDQSLEEVNQPFILKTLNSEVVHPYPKIALRELSTNALVHRSYEGTSPVRVYIESNCIRFVNDGGLVEELAERVQTGLQREIESGATGIRGYRNAVVADLFCGTGSMEKKGSGLPDVHRSVTKGGGKVVFGPTENNESFRAIVYRRPEDVDRTTGTAVPAGNVSRYYSNLLEVVSLPEVVWVIDASEQDLNPANAPTFPYADDLALCFASGEYPLHPLAITELLRTKDGPRQLTGLLNACLISFLRMRGLLVDTQRKRAYFPRSQEGSREITYKATMRQATRTVTKPFISKTTQKVLYWIHEAMWFGFERYSGTHALRILPGYVFTNDGYEDLLFHKRVGALATKKAARDFSLQVFNHLAFWSWVLADGHASVNIPTGAVGAPMVVSSSFSSCDISIASNADVPFTPETYQLRGDSELDSIEQEVEEDVQLTSEGSEGDTSAS